MTKAMLAAGVLAAVLAIAHGVGGELTNVRALLRDRTTDGDKLELRATWHLYTWQLALSAAALVAWWGGLADGGALLRWLLVGSFVGSAAVMFGFAVRGGLGVLVRHPQWLLLLAVGVLAFSAIPRGS